ncbi:Cas10/Cmr2 second palm domain-containing protein [Streptomyces albogriseolus]|uniref:Cas10/Cmr2 second palm domain-containing protein n=1 Tax=Streptomyces albogriseolus TaxID=1887 RepID=UPI003CFB77B0
MSFEAWNITRFMFVTGKRREIAGASELITYLDRQWVREALERLCEGFAEAWRIEENPVELLSTGAGTARVLVRDEDGAQGGELARRLVTEVTLAALRQAPGLDVFGAVGEPFAWEDDGALHAACAGGAADLARVRRDRPAGEARFMRLPLVDECASTGLPAEALVEQPGGGFEPLSAESRAKWAAYGRTGDGEGLVRLAALAHTTPAGLRRVVEELSETADWVGVVYVDGNGLGRVFQNFAACVPGTGNRVYADTLRSFTGRLQACAEEAFRRATATLGREDDKDAGDDRAALVLPLILGGDDVVAVCAGQAALPFTEAYLAAYEALTAADDVVAGVLRRRGGLAGLSASAGVAIVKAHFPFAAAARLAYDLLREAKQVKRQVPERPRSALAFHVLYDSSGVDLERIRAGTDVEDASLVAQPYVVGAAPEGNVWARGRTWADLRRRVKALRARQVEGNGEEGEASERLLPAAQLHDLREALFLGPEVADARLENLLPRFGARGLAELAGHSGGGDSLFWAEPSGRRVTGLLDAMAAESFLPPAASDEAETIPGASGKVAGERTR